MNTTLAADRRPGRASTATGTRPRRLRARKPLLVAHLIVSGTWLGAVVADLFLGISAATTGREDMADAYYAVMDRLVNNLMPAAAIATLATGLLLALATKWGLVRHYWVLAKLVLGVATVVVGVAAINRAIQDTIAARAADHSAAASDLLLPPSRPRRSCWPPRSRSPSPSPGDEPGAVGDRAPGAAPQPPVGAKVVSLGSRPRFCHADAATCQNSGEIPQTAG